MTMTSMTMTISTLQPRKPKPIIIYIIIDHNSAHRNHLNVIMSLSLMSLIKKSAQHLELSTIVQPGFAKLGKDNFGEMIKWV